MKPGVATARYEFETPVTEEMTATLNGRLLHPVYSTFWMAYHSEVAARLAIEPYFQEGENAVGGVVEVKHEAMAAIGDTVRICAQVTEIKGRKIVCEIEVFSKSRRIGTGRQVQITMANEEIERLVADAQARVANDI
ncbi:MAG: thioesterase [Ignavibacteriae bacterium]|nr:thioesterase [Ignavibacteriota bacterium]